MVDKYATQDPADLLGTITELARRVKSLEINNRGGFTAIDNGTLIVSGGLLEVFGEIGDSTPVFISGPDIGLNGNPGVAAWYTHLGTPAVTLYGDAPNSQFVAIYDQSVNGVFATDGASNQGLARPYLTIQGIRSAQISAPADSTTSATFVTFHSLQGYKQHPYVIIECIVLCGAGTSGELRAVDNHTGLVLATETLPSADFAYHFLFGAVSGGHLEFMDIDVQFRRTGGANLVAAQVVVAYGVQSP